jgi:hypothetical protein
MTASTNNNAPNNTHQTMNTTYYQPADPHTCPDAFGVSMQRLPEYRVLGCSLLNATGLQFTKCMADHRHLRCCDGLFAAQLLAAESRTGRHVDVHREGRCPECGSLCAGRIRLYLNGLIVTRDRGRETAWIRPIDPKPLGTWLEQYVFWSAVDWTKQDCELAHEHRVSNSRVWEWRRRLRQPRSPRYHHHRNDRTAAKYRGADWTKADSELAPHFGVTRQRIHQVRQKVSRRNRPSGESEVAS